MTAANGIEARSVSLCHFEFSHLIEDSGASVALAKDSDANRLGVLDEKGNPLASSPIFALVALCLPQVPGGSSLVSLAQSLSLELTPRLIALVEDRK